MTGRRRDAGEDAIIGRAFRWSLLVIVILALAVAATVYLLREGEQAQAPVEDAGMAAPETAASGAAPEPPPVPFTDITEQAGIDFVHENGARGDKLLPETMGSGAAFFDYDGDGDPDLLLNNGRYWEGRHPEGADRPTPALYRNDSNGQFTEVTAEVGLDVSLYGTGVAVADYDGDGRKDVLLAALGRNRLFHNEGDGFREVTEEAGVSGADDAWTTSAAFLDYDRDGDLDLFAVNYVQWSRAIDYEVDYRLTGIGRAYGPPTNFQGTDPYLYRNDGDGSFTDVSAEAGVQVDNPATGRPMAKALAVTALDVDGNGWLDLFVANDTVRNFLFLNQGDGTFEEVGIRYGVAFDRDGAATGAMGTDAAHFRNDADLGLAVGNFANEMTSLYVTQGGAGLLTDESIVEGIGPASRQALTFGLFFFDYDLDGRMDLLQVNGHLEQEINKVQSSQHYEQPAQLFWNCGPRCRAGFVPVPRQRTGDLGRPAVGRGASYADIDADGDQDVLITQVGRRPRLLRNDQAQDHHWLRLRLAGHSGNRDAIGAEVAVEVGDRLLRRRVMPTRSYLSQVEPTLTFGLAEAEAIDGVRIRWPDGTEQDLGPLAVDREHRIERGR